MHNFKPAHMVRGYKITFYQDNKNIGHIFVASNDSLQAEITGRKIAGKGITVKVTRE